MRGLLLFLVACGARTPVATSRDAGAAADASAVVDASAQREAAAPPCDRARPFLPPVRLRELNTPDRQEGMLRLSPDGLTAYFQRYSEDRFWDIHTATRSSASAPFENERPIEAINTKDGEGGAFPSADGLTLYFVRYVLAANTFEVLVTTRASASADFGPPRPAGLPRPSWSPYLARDDVLYFSTEDDVNIARTTRSGASLGAHQIVLRSPDTELWPTVTADELTMYYSAGGSGVGRGIDIMLATRPSTSARWTSARLDELDTDGDEVPSFITPDGCTFWFTSDRAGTHDIWYARKP